MDLHAAIFALANVLDAAGQSTSYGTLDACSQRILLFVGERQRSGQDTSLGDITAAPRLGGSQVTLMKRVRSLQAAGLLALLASPRHHRRLQIELTPAAIAMLNEVSSRLEPWLQAPPSEPSTTCSLVLPTANLRNT